MHEQKRKHFYKSPITEALIDIQVKPSEGITLETLDKITKLVKDDYPTRQDQNRIEAQFVLPPKTRVEQLGYIFSHKGSKQSFQARLDGFTLNKLAPYEDWETFQGEAKRLWKIYQSIVHSETVTRVAVRYINRLELPATLKDFREYITSAPDVSTRLPQGLSGFFLQLQIPLEELEAMLILNEAMLPSTGSDSIPVALDLDISKSVNLPSEEDTHWAILETLHDKVDNVFRASITEEMERIIE